MKLIWVQVRVLLALGIALLLFLSPGAVAQTATTDTIGRFHVEGLDIIGPDGDKVVLRGVNKSGLEYTAWGYDLDLATFEQMKSWGANVVRLALTPAFALPTMCTYKSNYLKTIDRIVSYGEQLKLLIVLDNHLGTSGLPCGLGNWISNQKAPDVFNLAFAKLLANRYKDRTYVAIDLYNEPHDTSTTVWRKGGLVDTYLGVGMQKMLDEVRSTGFANLVFATGPQWGNDLRTITNNPLTHDKNVVYGAHSYPFVCGPVTVPVEEPYECGGNNYPTFLDAWVEPALAVRPVMLTEFGTYRPIDAENRAPIQWAEDRGIGWMAWLWCNGKVSDFCLLTADRTNTPTVIGQPIYDVLSSTVAAPPA